jgi:hypothetical protein
LLCWYINERVARQLNFNSICLTRWDRHWRRTRSIGSLVPTTRSCRTIEKNVRVDNVRTLVSSLFVVPSTVSIVFAHNKHQHERRTRHNRWCSFNTTSYSWIWQEEKQRFLGQVLNSTNDSVEIGIQSIDRTEKTLCEPMLISWLLANHAQR